MQSTATVLLSCATSAVIAAATVTLMGSQLVEPLPSDQVGDAAIAEKLRSLRERCDQLHAQVGQLQALPAPQRVAARADVDAGTVRELVDAALRERGELADADAQKASLTADGSTMTAVDWFALLAELEADGEDVADAWLRIESADQLDAVLDVYRAEVASAPQSVIAQHELARAAHAAAMSRPNHKDGRFWTESDGAYQKILDVDPEHWDARYEKAVKLTFWPDAFGRRPEAMKHFETLIEQQAVRPAEERHVSVYVWLGNLHAQQGDPERARKVWRQGLQRHPDAHGLRERLASLDR